MKLTKLLSRAPLLFLLSFPIHGYAQSANTEANGLTILKMKQILQEKGFLQKIDLSDFLKTSRSTMKQDIPTFATTINPTEVNAWLAQIGLTEPELNDLFVSNNDSVNNYTTLSDIKIAFYKYTIDDIVPVLPSVLTQMGFDAASATRITNHIQAIPIDSTFVSNMDNLLSQMSSAINSNLTPEQALAQMDSYFNALMDVFGLKLIYTLDNGSIVTMTQLAEIESKAPTPFSMEVYDSNGQFLGEINFTKDMLEDLMGGLPNTAGNYIPNILLAILLGVTGFVLYGKTRKPPTV